MIDTYDQRDLRYLLMIPNTAEDWPPTDWPHTHRPEFLFYEAPQVTEEIISGRWYITEVPLLSI